MTVVAVVISMSAVPIERRPIIGAIVRIVAIVRIRPIVAIRVIPIITREPDSYTKPYASVSALDRNKSDSPCHQSDQENFFPVHYSTSLLFYLLQIKQSVRPKVSGFIRPCLAWPGGHANILTDSSVRDAIKLHRFDSVAGSDSPKSDHCSSG